MREYRMENRTAKLKMESQERKEMTLLWQYLKQPEQAELIRCIALLKKELQGLPR